MARRAFRRAIDVDRSFIEYAILPDSEKLRLCQNLLSEFGANNVQVSPDGEMLHSCLLPPPYGTHANGDRHPSASLNYKKLVFTCYGCGSSGGLLWWIGICRNANSSEEVREWLKGQTGVGDPDSLAARLALLDAFYHPTVSPQSPIPRFSPKVLDPWMIPHDYMLEDRRIPLEVMHWFRVGYNPSVKVKVKDQWVESQRIVLPHFWRGDLVGWQTRRLGEDGTPKYLSSLDFPGGRSIFNYHPGQTAVVVESVMSVLARYVDCPNMEATFGASVTDRQIDLLADHPKVTLFLDNDEAGWKATEHLAKALIPQTNVWVVDNPYACDPADMDSKTFAEVMQRRVPAIGWTRPTKGLMPWPP